MNAPCKDCTKRYVGCHATCEGYIQAKQEHLVAKEQDDKRRYIQSLLDKPYRVKYKSKY